MATLLDRILGIFKLVNVPVEFFIKLAGTGWDRIDYYTDKLNTANLRGKRTIAIRKSDYDTALRLIEKKETENSRLSDAACRNNNGIEKERIGDIDDAISIYEDNISDGYPALHSYERLMIIYRRRKDFENETRVINRAIEVFSDENRRRAEKASKAYPTLTNAIYAALDSGEKVMGTNGFFCFCPYDILKFQKRLEKVKILQSKQRTSDGERDLNNN